MSSSRDPWPPEANSDVPTESAAVDVAAGPGSPREAATDGPSNRYDYSDIWAKFEEFENSFARLFSLAAEKFADDDDVDHACTGAADATDTGSSSTDASGPLCTVGSGGGCFEGVRVESAPGLGRVLVAARSFAMYETVLEESPAVILRQEALQRISRLRQAATCLPAAIFERLSTTYEVHLDDAPEIVAKQIADTLAVETHEESSTRGETARQLLALYMAFRVNGMQWGRDHVALCDIGSKAAHSCTPNSGFTQKGARQSMTVASLRGGPQGAAGEDKPTLPQNERFLEVKNARPLSAGDQITFSYLDDPDDLLCPTAVRRRRLRAHRFFLCQCVRCEKSDENGDPCRGLPCARPSCAGTAYFAQRGASVDMAQEICFGTGFAADAEADEAEDRGSRRYASCDADGSGRGLSSAALAACFLCSTCGCRGVDPGLVDLETKLTQELGHIHGELGELALANVAMAASLVSHGLNAEPFIDSGALDRIDEFYEKSRPLGTAHWLTCRAALLRWRASLARAGLSKTELQEQDCSLLEESITFVEAQCPDLIVNVAAPWVAEAARYLYDAGNPERALAVYPHFAALESFCAREEPTDGFCSPFQECVGEAWHVLFTACKNVNLDAMD